MVLWVSPSFWRTKPEPQNPISALFSYIVPPALYSERSAETGRYNYLFHRLRWGYEARVSKVKSPRRSLVLLGLSFAAPLTRWLCECVVFDLLISTRQLILHRTTGIPRANSKRYSKYERLPFNPTSIPMLCNRVKYTSIAISFLGVRSEE
jgi:hypothetical protein